MSSTPPPDDVNPPQYPGPAAGAGGYPVHPGTPPGEAFGPLAANLPQPRSIQLAATLMRFGAALSALGLIVGLTTLGGLKDDIRAELEKNDLEVTQATVDTVYAVSVGTVLLFGALGVVLWLWMASKNGAGRGWARIVATVFGVLAVLSALASLTSAGTPVLSLLVSLATAVLAVVILVLLWRPDSSRFYAAHAAAGPR